MKPTSWDEIAGLTGDWSCRRLVYDGLSRAFLRGEGHCTFQPEGKRLRQVESLVFNGLEASRTYLWEVRETAVWLLYEDGRPLVPVTDSQKDGRHLCGQDLYEVRLSEWALRCFTLSWRVQGPRKDYAMVTRYRRMR